MEQIPMTREGYDKLKAQLDEWQNADMPTIAKQIAEAREFGDLKENAEYHAAREAQGMLNAKINDLSDRLSRAIILDPSKMDTSIVGMGCSVTVKDLEFDDEEEYTLVGAGEEDYMQNKILMTSPMAKALAGKKVGDQTEFEAPAGTVRFEILKIEYNL